MSMRRRYDGFLWRMTRLWFSIFSNGVNRLTLDDNRILYYNEVPLVASTPTGAVLPWPGANLPDPNLALPCDGAAVSRTTYANLFAAIGTTYGVGDGATTFNVPDMKDRLAWQADGVFAIFGMPGGAANHTHVVDGHTVTIDQLPSHDHSPSYAETRDNMEVASSGQKSAYPDSTSNAAGGDVAHAHTVANNGNRPAFLTFHYVIYV